jgi:hypothetical protein
MTTTYKLILILEVYHKNPSIQFDIEDKLALQLKPTNKFDRVTSYDSAGVPIYQQSFEATMEWSSLSELVFDWLIKIEELAVQWMIRKPVQIGDKWLFCGAAYKVYNSIILLENTFSISFQIHEV